MTTLKRIAQATRSFVAKIHLAIVLCAVLFTLSACGQKGPLYLVPEPSSIPAPQTISAAPALVEEAQEADADAEAAEPQEAEEAEEAEAEAEAEQE